MTTIIVVVLRKYNVDLAQLALFKRVGSRLACVATLSRGRRKVILVPGALHAFSYQVSSVQPSKCP